ncbi:deoxyribodipyrimidine photo-lyase [Serratia microhaemolytica]|uniref:deoxyribodipyrimidine photo-lyase n=1 Tax=Serratia microhaemolytica TaxID=2675110 RepID=UPI000FDEF7FE|nr:deoxyribodipyrimidine photo-lyase [Serratia microhaemolytica]
MTTHLVWFRNDLRITDNLALNAACSDATAQVIAVFIATPQQWRQHDMAPRQAAFIHAHLLSLQQALAERGIELYSHQSTTFSDAVHWLVQFCQQRQVSALFYNRQYEFNERQRDAALERALAGQVHCQGFDDSLLLAPGTVTTANGEMYKVYTPFRRAFLQQLQLTAQAVLPAPAARATPLPLHPLPAFDYPQLPVGSEYPVGETAALQRLRHFCRERVARYAIDRDLPAVPGTSQLSAYLAIGVLSVRQCFNRLRLEWPDLLDNPQAGAFCWLNELIWREFYRHLLVAYPRLSQHRPFIGWTDNIRWRNDSAALAAWQQGRTGYPIVDAAMRQLNQTGWMHNRLRMICASFLVKDLLIDWRLGERYFMSQLIDGDLAANNGGWQWAASTGTDAAPYFRIFNPTTQGKRFDPAGTFIVQWLPELQQVPENERHQPQRWAQQQRRALDYPAPIVDHQQARLATLAAFEAAKTAST